MLCLTAQLVLLILGCFTCCWLPYFIVACAQMFSHRDTGSPTVYKATFSLAMANSGMNPMIYAWKNPALRRAFALLLRGRNPDHVYDDVWSTAAAAGGGESKRQRRRRLAQAQQTFEHIDAAAGGDAKALAPVEAAAAAATPTTPPTVADAQRAWVQQTADDTGATTVRRSCCELDVVWLHSERMFAWNSCSDGQHRLMDILHIDGLEQMEPRAARATTPATTTDKWMNHRISNRT